MQFRRIVALVLVFVLVFWLGALPTATHAQDLVQAPDDFVFYELSNMRVERSVVGEQIAFDYKRVREGKGTVMLAARTDDGPISIRGFGLRIEATGTIRLEDRFARVRSALNPGRSEFGVEFFFTAHSDTMFSRDRYLVSNSVTYGTMNTRVQARPPSAEELAAKERERKAKIPPETVPAGYTRSDATTPLVPGAPVLIGVVGEWVPAKVVSLRSSSFVRVLPDGRQALSTVSRDGWIAIADQTIDQIRSDPGQFSLNVRTLPDGNALLPDDVKSISEAMPSGLLSLPAGTPLMLEKHSRWEDVFFLSSDNVTARVLPANHASPKEERVSVNALAIRQRTLDDLSSDAAKAAFAANVANYTPVSPPATIAPKADVASMASPVASSVPFPSFPGPDEGSDASPSIARVWRDQSGKFSITATLESRTETEVLLKRPDGNVIKVSISRLSDADREFLAQDGESADANPFASVVSPSPPAAGPLNYRLPLKGVFQVGDLRGGARSVAISPGDRFLLVGRSAASVSMYDLRSRRQIIDSGRMDHLGDVSVCGFTPDNKHVLLGGMRGIVEVYEIDDNGKLQHKHQFTSHTRGVSSLAFSRDGKFALTGGEDRQAVYWEVETGRALKTLSGFDGKVKATCICPSGNKLMATDGKTLQTIDLAEGNGVKTLQVGRSPASGQAAAFSPNGLLLAVGDGYHFSLWNLQLGSELPRITGSEIGWCALFAPDNQHLITGGNGVINFWDAKTQSLVQSFRVTNSFYIRAINTNAAGSLIVCPSGHSSVGVYQASP